MPAQIRIPYYTLDFSGFFTFQRAWRLFNKERGCRPLKNPQTAILMERKPPPLPDEKPTEAKKTEKTKLDNVPTEDSLAAKKVALSSINTTDINNNKAEQSFKISAKLAKTKRSVVECKSPPPFDMLDLPDAMEKVGFTVAAKLSRRWFNSRKHEIPSNGRLYVYPDDMVDTKIVSLDFVLKYPRVRAKYEDLISKGIYDDAAMMVIKDRIEKLVANPFINNDIAYSGELDAFSHSNRNIQKLHSNFQFQTAAVSNLDTLDWTRGLTDLTASLANFSFAAAIANARIDTQKFYNYPKGNVPVYCCQSKVEITHVYVYARDSYSFEDRPGRKASQYLGHWNRNGVILIPTAVVSDVATHYDYDFEWGNAPYSDDGFDGPVDVLKGMFGGEMREQDVYYPVHNGDYLKWREKFGRGGDFAIYTEPKRIKLPNPIQFTLEPICKPAKLPSGK